MEPLTKTFQSCLWSGPWNGKCKALSTVPRTEKAQQVFTRLSLLRYSLEMKRSGEHMRMAIKYLMAEHRKYASDPFHLVPRDRFGLIGWRLLRDNFYFHWKETFLSSKIIQESEGSEHPCTGGVWLAAEVFLNPGGGFTAFPKPRQFPRGCKYQG